MTDTPSNLPRPRPAAGLALGVAAAVARILQTPRGLVGAVLIATCWPLNWLLPGTPTAYLFFPLWLGYVLVIDALVEHHTGTSLWLRSRRDFILLFVASAPAWWLFEVFNSRTQNWEYRGRGQFSQLEYVLLASLSFSTVMPAVFVTAELALGFRWIQRLCANGWKLRLGQATGWQLWCAGWLMLSCVLLWPRYAYPLVWLSVFFLLEPLNAWLGHRHLAPTLRQGDWRPLVALSTGALICGGVWEFWNYWSYPKWVYHTPGAQFLHVFEMPLLGYGGYLPFAWELYALRNLVWKRGPAFRV